MNHDSIDLKHSAAETGHDGSAESIRASSSTFSASKSAFQRTISWGVNPIVTRVLADLREKLTPSTAILGDLRSIRSPCCGLAAAEERSSRDQSAADFALQRSSTACAAGLHRNPVRDRIGQSPPAAGAPERRRAAGGAEGRLSHAVA